jgi:hypothetical protein
MLEIGFSYTTRVFPSYFSNFTQHGAHGASEKAVGFTFCLLNLAYNQKFGILFPPQPLASEYIHAFTQSV